MSIAGEGNPHVDKQYFNGQYNGVKVYARVCTPLWITAPGYVWKHKRGGVVSQNSTLYLARLSDLEDLAVGRSRQKVIKTHEYRATVGYGIMTSGRIIGGDYFNLHTLAHEGPMMYGRILPMFFGTVRFVPNDHGYYLTEFRSYASSTKNTYDATVDPGLTLDLGSVPCEGYATMSPAKKYFGVPGKKLIESWPMPALPEVVQITAHGLPGYCFDGWSGDGGCWPYKPCEDELVFDPPLALEDTNHTNKTVWIAMDDSKAVTPKFERGCCSAGLTPFEPVPRTSHCYTPREPEEIFNAADCAGNRVVITCVPNPANTDEDTYLGHYEVEVNGKLATECIVSPGFNMWVFYKTRYGVWCKYRHLNGEQGPEQDYETFGYDDRRNVRWIVYDIVKNEVERVECYGVPMVEIGNEVEMRQYFPPAHVLYPEDWTLYEAEYVSWGECP